MTVTRNSSYRNVSSRNICSTSYNNKSKFKRKVVFLRRFFISILILSALSSESAVSFYENFYCLLYPYAENSLSVYFEDFSEQLSEQLTEQIKEDTSESYFYESDVSETVSPLYKVIKDNKDCTGLIDNNFSALQKYVENQLQNAFNLSYSLSIVLPNEDIILQISDLSPPAIIYA